FVADRGREVQRQMVQDHLDLRAAREQETAREHESAVAGPDGIPRTRLETGHRRLLATLFGTVQVTRCAWRRPGAGNLYPADAAWGAAGGHRQGGRPPGQDAHPAGSRGEAEPQADGHPGMRL